VRIDDFDYDLPRDLIAQEPANHRDESRLLTISRLGSLVCAQHLFADLPDLLSAGDLVVVNDTRVLPSRIWARRGSGGIVEILLVAPVDSSPAGAWSSPPGASSSPAGASSSPPGASSSPAGALSSPLEASSSPLWRAMVRPARRIRPGDELTLLLPHDEGDVSGNEAPPVVIEVAADLGGGQRALTFPAGCDVEGLLESVGSMPLPPYILRDRDDPRGAADRRRYQTVYACEPGAIAAPTAGLHFTPELMRRLGAAGIEHASLTLHVGPGTFQPIRADDAEDHVMEAERYEIPRRTVDAIERARARGGRVVAVGTTVVRTLEYVVRAATDGKLIAGRGNTDLYILPGFEFRVVDAMITNFHLPRSTPLLLVSALAGRERLLAAYRVAIESGFRFYSYGDAMLVL